MTDVATLLSEARRTAALARTALKDRKDAKPHFVAALKAREAATALDPQYADPAWDDDLVGQAIQGLGRSRKRDKRLTDAQLIAQQNADLIEYFKIQLGQSSNPTTVSSQLEDVVVPQEWRQTRAGVQMCQCGHPDQIHDPSTGLCDAGQPRNECPCGGFALKLCKHRWHTKEPKRECADCGEQQQLFPTMAAEDTLAHQQVLRERKGQA